MPTVIDHADELLAALDRGESLASSWYTDPSILEKEIAKVFRKSWQYIGCVQNLASIGDFMTGYVGDVPVVIVRNLEGIQGFVNVCRHRRHVVMEGCGNTKVMQCPYHAWTYGLDGKLEAAPRCDKEQDFQLYDYPLLPVQVDSLGPFIFANLDPACNTLDYHFGPVLDVINESGIDLSQLWLHSRKSWDSQANWKVMLENYLECYHCPVAHPAFSAAIDVDQESYQLLPHEWFLSQVGSVRRPLRKSAGKEIKLYDLEGDVSQAQYHLLWPNFTISINPGFPNLSVDVWLPHGVNRTRGFTERYFGPNVDEKWAQEVIAFNEQVAKEDEALTSMVQEGLCGAIPEKGRFLRNSEQLIIHFQKLLLRALSAGE